MSKSFLVSLTLAIGLAAPASVYAYGGAQTAHRHHVAHHRAIHPLATARVPASVSLAAPAFVGIMPLTFVAPQEPDARQGLGRDPGDCAQYGCIDNGGG